MRISKLKPKEIKQCVKILNQNKKDMGDLHDEQSLEKARSYNHYWVVKVNGKIAGLVGLADLENGIGMILSLVVAKDYKRQGIGKALIRHVKKQAAKKRFRKVLLLTHVFNKPMMILAIKEDFIPEGSLKQHFRDERDVIYFSYFIN